MRFSPIIISFAILGCASPEETANFGTEDAKSVNAEIEAIPPVNVHRCDNYIESDQPLVAHGGGGLPSGFYRNDLEALDLAARHGFQLVEIDFVQRDGVLLVGHDDNRLSDMSIHELVGWSDRNPTISIITDMKDDNLRGLRVLRSIIGSKASRFIPQIYRSEQYDAVRAMGYPKPIFAVGRDENPNWLDWVETADLFAVTISVARIEEAQQVTAHPVYLFTVNEAVSGFGLYTDCLIPPQA